MLEHLHLLTPIICPSQAKEDLRRERNGLEWERDQHSFLPREEPALSIPGIATRPGKQSRLYPVCVSRPEWMQCL